jgi:HAD superfamily hydrolase (TIGR01509 family)
MLKAAIFDLDGTLMDSEVLWVEAVERYLDDRGHAIGHEEAVSLVYGRSASDIYDDIMTRFPEIDETADEMDEALRVYIQELHNGHDIIIEGSVHLLKRLASEMQVCIVSGSPVEDIVAGLELMDIESDVKFVLGAEDYSPGKPDPACFLMAAERLGVIPAECIVFEDSAAGIQAARSAGMRCVALVREGYPVQNVEIADQVVSDLAYFDLASIKN